MTNNNFKRKKTITGIFSIMAICFCLMFGVFLSAQNVYAYTEQAGGWSNLNFASNSTTSVYTSPTGWTKGFSDSKATSGTINLEKSKKENTYLGSENLPTKLNDNADDYVLMLNARNKQNESSSASAVQYYTNSSTLKLDAYSNYKIVVWTRVLQDAQGSIYIVGMDETLGFERITYAHASEWTAYTFYITTGIDTQSIKTELWLGSKNKNQSTNAVFYDNVEVFKVSNNETPEVETAEDKLVASPESKSDKVKYINLDERTAPSEIANANFENDDISSWTKIAPAMKVGTFRGVLDESSKNTSIGRNIQYLGTDLTKNNTKALVFYTEDDVTSYFGLKSASISVKAYDIVKISLNVKASLKSGNAYIKLVENDILNANGEVIEEIETSSETITISSTGTNSFLNDYNSYSFYVKARSLYNTSFNLELTLGSSEEEASGIVAFDNITIEYISDNDFSSASTGTYVKKINQQSTTNSFGITNSTFNTTEKENRELHYPLVPADWTHTAGDESSVHFGVINTNNELFNEMKGDFKINSNPGNPEGFLPTSQDTNNVLLMYNFRETFQSATSKSFSLDTNSYYKLSFAYKLLPTSATKDILNVYITDEDGNVLYSDEKISQATSDWKNYIVYISSNSYSNSLKLVLSLGNEENQVTGQAYFDNATVVKQSDMTLETYQQLSKENNVLDFQEGNFNLVEHNGSDMFKALRYTGKLEEGTNPEFGIGLAQAGIVDAENTEDEYEVECSPENENAIKYMMTIKTYAKALYSMTAIDSISLTTGNYYKFTVYVKTMFTSTSDEDYGAEFSLNGIEEKIDKIVAPEWTKYTIYVNCTEDVSINLKFALKSADTNTAGIVYFDNFAYETVDADDFNVTRLNFEDDKTYLFIGDTNADTDNNENSNNFNPTALWYAIPTALLAVALILALVVYLMKKVKIKKWEKRKVNQYDREKTVHRDVIRAEAEKRRNASVKELGEQIKSYQQEIEKIDEVRNQRQESSRSDRSKGVTRAQEREFKQFARRRTAIENRIVMLNKQIDNMNTAEYLLTVQHQIAVEKARAEREAREKSFEKKKNK